MTTTQPVVPLAHGAVRLRGVRKVFGGRSAAVTVLQDLDLDVAPGEFLAVVGGSGCGKSTLLSLVAGLTDPTSGTLEVGGKVALMFQEATLLPWLTAARNVELALELQGVGRSERRDRARHLLGRVRLGRYAEKRPHELSGGMRQRVALARVLAQDAAVVCMDEPLGALDALTRDQMHDLVEDIWLESRFTVLFVTHNVREAVRLADRAILMGGRPGRVVDDHPNPMPRPRVMDSPAVATRAGTLTQSLKEEVASHDQSDYFVI
ncbi:MAG: ABC transporter ATP-binding protein [Actinobacteria bacterium]|nr:ABC transporter ATP-binding protein [Actinomycetota bacterium]